MRIVITIDTDSDAFRPDPVPEVVRLLSEAADYAHARGLVTTRALLDLNGNTVGSVLVTPETP